MSAPTVDPQELVRWNSAQRRAHIHYDALKADHALPHGCDSCTIGSPVLIAEGWTFHADLDLLFCPHCTNLAHVVKRIAMARYHADSPSRRELVARAVVR